MSPFATISTTQSLGPCHTRPAVVALSREYCLHDPAGRPIGTIAAPARRPEVGPAAPTFYLRRTE